MSSTNFKIQATRFPSISPELRASARIKRLRFYAESGNLCGESHPKAVLTDHEVTLMLELHSEGFSHAWLSEKFEVPKMTVRSICRGRTRGVPVARVVKPK